MNALDEFADQLFKSLEEAYMDFVAEESLPVNSVSRFAFMMSAVQEIEKDTEALEWEPTHPLLDRIKADLAMLACEIPSDVVMKMKNK